jgi:riboflavin kinase/FMN adenylyltransferase
VRTALVRGDVESAADMLGRAYRFVGEVVKGEGRGRTLDFPTANLEAVDPNKVLPANGVYAVWVDVGRTRVPGAMYIGSKPTFGGGARGVEVHLIGGSMKLYGKRVGVSFVKRLRGDAAFEGPDALRKAIGNDVTRARRLLAT